MANEDRTSVLVSTFPPFPTLNLLVPSSTPVSSVYSLLVDRYPSLPHELASTLLITTQTGYAPDDETTLSTLCSEDSNLVTLRLAPRILGGKGGFGSQLRAAGGRMSSQKTNNNDSCRDLSGRRLSTIREAKKLAEYLESEPERLAAKAEAQKAKLEALERKLGIDPNAKPGESSNIPPEILAGKKHKLDSEYVEQTKELSENVKSAVSAAFLKKRKKAKTSHSPSEGTTPKPDAAKKDAKAEEATPATATPTLEEKAKEVPPAVVATPLDAIGA
ncbi:hypothetical protein CC1G_06310 [Coprinopsis cinerea okayama7|uniref:Uncharacterized protein n=1 Tax=Coprinopsis cinerea (strain Okayama-7 / 130 / ATCC MYA-4618 / FGSC 9003) TaxID=240176 RepID=A8NTG8_COPC7|nr:hypothetical protein CC1G_06310 [Coprinopsis cinerea okayama7\|eukprot:XP_001836225.1 hypothetical protein CC1G_06310 [Coprinopsis cinerea okayama7\